MLKRFSELYEFVMICLNRLNSNHEMLTKVKLNVVSELCLILEPFYEITKEMSTEKYVEISKILPVSACLLNCLQSINVVTIAGKQLKINIIDIYKERLKPYEQSDLICMATLLDPRFKKSYLNSHQLDKMIKLINTEMNATDFPVNEHQNLLVCSSSKGSIWDFHDCNIPAGNLHLRSATELSKYMKIDLILRRSNPLEYWQNSRYIFPNLKTVAVKYLISMASSTPCERLFSKAGLMLESRRNRLTGKKVDKLLFLSALNSKQWKESTKFQMLDQSA